MIRARIRFRHLSGVDQALRLNDPFRLAREDRVELWEQPHGSNMWLADARDLAGIELRYPHGQEWSGEGYFAYVREAEIIGQRATSG